MNCVMNDEMPAKQVRMSFFGGDSDAQVRIRTSVECRRLACEGASTCRYVFC